MMRWLVIVLDGGIEIVVDMDCQGTRVEMGMKSKQRAWQWIKGKVAVSEDHMELRYGDSNKENDWAQWPGVARVASPKDGIFRVEILIKGKTPLERKMIREARKELNFYLKAKGEEDPWAYARHHCGTTSNFYSLVHWAFMPPRDRGKQPNRPQSANCRVVEGLNLQEGNLEGNPSAIALGELEAGQAYLVVCFNHNNNRRKVVRTTTDFDAVLAVGTR